MRDKTEFADVVLIGAHIRGSLDLSGSKVTDKHKLDMRGFQVERSLFMGDKAEFADVALIGAHIRGALVLSGSKVTGMLDMNEIDVDQSLSMSGEAEFADVALVDARVGGELNLSGSKVTGKLDMRGFRVDQFLHMSDKAEFADVELLGAHIGGGLDLRGSKVTGKLGCYGLEAAQQVLMGGTFGDLIECRIARIKGDLHLDYGQFKKTVDLSGAEIGGGLHLDSAKWSDGAALALRDAKVGIIPALAGAWAPKLDLDGLTYRSAGTADQFEDWFGRFDHYAPQPYDQLASVIQSQGNSTLATAIRYSGRERERREATGRAWVWLTTLKWVIGYGYYPYRAIFWVIGLVMAGAMSYRRILVTEGVRRQRLELAI
jgi:hypothetical protein